MATTEAVPQTTSRTAPPPTGPDRGPDTDTRAGTATGTGTGTTDPCAYQPVPVWFFAFEGLIGASYDVLRTSRYGWVVVAVAVAVNIVLTRTVLRGRLKTAKAILRGRQTRLLAVGLLALRVGAHFALGMVGAEAASPVAHTVFAGLMCATTVTLLAFDQRVMLRALNSDRCASA
ncbi:hypothetical protein [Streptomyces sp. CA2R106]|uniref:hypothetical protein n=1 Tax=Streptomyces sp. CA2R106 TaxID=3120153 RepID=UPI00300954C0